MTDDPTMFDVGVPFYGSLVIALTLVAASYTFAMSVAAGRGRPHLLTSARFGTFATCALVVVAILLLAYAFQTHDFRIRYVARYSDRSMPWWYLVTSLWGGQDGSLLWWSFLLCGWTASVTLWMRNRYTELQPWILATLMAILMFFLFLMIFAANPFATTPASTPPDGEGLNPLLQNYWMTIHPPTLYMGFIGWSVPFAFCIAALITGRLHDEWIVASRRWMLAAWLFLSIGLMLGMLWSYEELGWGGYWAWDPVENASFMPWLVGTAFLHSIMIQERYGMLKVWNVFLMALTFFMTIFGTFLTRSGLISSVHSFARSGIGIWFVFFMLVLITAVYVLIGWRLPKLKAIHRIESLVSREFAFLLNNWVFLVIMVVVCGLTIYPAIHQLVNHSEVTVGPPVFNRFMTPFGIVLLVLAGVGPLIAWRKATGKNLLQAFAIPTAVGVACGAIHVFFGNALGFPPYVDTAPIYDTATGTVLRTIFGVSPVLSSASCGFVFATILQEFWRGTSVRMKNKKEDPFSALFTLVARANRRYGGYIVHVGAVMMFIGFTGSCYDVEKEATLRPGEVMVVGRCDLIEDLSDEERAALTMEERERLESQCGAGWLRTRFGIRYDGSRFEEDENATKLIAEVTILDADDGAELAGLGRRLTFDEMYDVLSRAYPAKHIYRTHPEMPTTEVDIRSRPIEDVYTILSTIDGRSDRATFRVVVRPLVLWIWLGGIVLVIGTFIGMAPSIQELLGKHKARSATIAASVFLGLALLAPNAVEAQDSSSLHAGHVSIDDPIEKVLFERLLCMCGDCQRLSLATCACSWAEDMRTTVRGRLANGETPEQIQESYRAEFGARALSIPTDRGLDRAAWAVPVGAGLAGAIAVVGLGLVWRKRSKKEAARAAAAPPAADEKKKADEYDSKIDAELDRMED
jgi:cytochrome c-type biogenesis protein CcmF